MLIANLLAEAEWAEVGSNPADLSNPAGLPALTRPPASQLARGRKLAAASAVAGSLMRILALDDREQLWLPSLPESLDLPRLAGLPDPILRSAGALDAGADPSLIAWAETPWVAGLRALRQAGPISTSRARPAAVDALADNISTAAFCLRLRDLEAPSPAAAARANHRAFSLSLSRRRAWSLPGEAMIHDFDALAGSLDSLARGAVEAPAWVLKAAWSAAGRDRIFGRGAKLDDPALRARIAAHLDRSPALRLEPWMQREADYGCVGLALPEGPRLLGMHRLYCDRRGVFRSIELSRAEDARRRAAAIGLRPEEQSALREAFAAAGEALASIDYRGPYGIDAWRYRDEAENRSGFQRLGEINARLTLGHLAHLLVDRLGLASAGGEFGGVRADGSIDRSWDEVGLETAKRRRDADDGLMRLELGRRSGMLPPGSQVLASADGFMAWLAPAPSGELES